jgi:glucose/arabinose dehydrogenase
VRRAVSLGLVFLMMAGAIVILAPAPPVAAAGQIEVYKAGLNFPIALAFSSDGRIFFAEKTTGSIRIIYLANRTLLPTPFITLPSTDGTGERGLLGLALEPGFPSTPYVYAYQTYNDVTNGTTYNRIVRILASGNVGVSYTVILRMPPLSGATNHNGGVIAFGPDGKLWAVVGENANPSLAQDPMSTLGKVLRMNSDGSAAADNPFYGSLSSENRVYTYGHRNMFGIAWQPVTGRAYVTENGPACNDEVNLLPNLTAPDRNYGWGPTASCGSLPPPADTNRDGPSPVFPIWWWGTTICPTNAAIYGGPYFPAWHGDLFMGDCNTGRFHRLHLVPPNYDSVASDDILWTAPTSIIAVAIGPDGAFWLTTPSTIYRYWDSGQPPIASFTAIPNPTIVGSPVAFDASGSSDPDGNIVSYAWDFGDSTGGSGDTVSHSYLTFGTFNATLTITDNESFTATAYRHIVARAPPIASFTATPNPAIVGASVTFNASASRDPDGNIVAYAWDFGDSTTGAGVLASHAFAAKGISEIQLTVVDNDGLANQTTRTLAIPDRAPQITSSTPGVGPLTVDAGATQTFTVIAWDPDGDVLTYTWRVDGALAGGNTNALSFASATPGPHTVNVTVSDGSLVASRDWTVTVVEAAFPALLTSWPFLAFVFAVIGAVFLVWWFRRRRKIERPPRSTNRGTF